MDHTGLQGRERSSSGKGERAPGLGLAQGLLQSVSRDFVMRQTWGLFMCGRVKAGRRADQVNDQVHSAGIKGATYPPDTHTHTHPSKSVVKSWCRGPSRMKGKGGGRDAK